MKRYRLKLSWSRGGDGFTPREEKTETITKHLVREPKVGQRLHINRRTWTVLGVEVLN